MLSDMLPLETRPLMVLSAVLGAPQRLGQTPLGDRKIVPVLGGTVLGERISGSVLPGGGDWALTRPDGILLLDVRLTIQTDDDALIHMTYDGMRHGPPEVMARLAAGETVPPDAMYFRIAPRFETSAQRYGWMNAILAVGIGERLPEGPRYHIHEIL